MLIFDVNCMVGKSGAPRPDWPETPGQTVEALSRAGIQRALVSDFASLQYDPVDGETCLARQVCEHRGFLEPCPMAVPHWGQDVPEPKELLDRFLERGCRAFRVYPKTHYFLLHPVVVGPLLEEAQARRFTVLIDRDQFEWPELIRILESFDRLKLIVVNEGYREMRTIIPLIERFPELRFETSWMQQFGLYEQIVGRFGARPLVFGTHFPVFEPGAALAPVLRANIDDEDRDRILGGNLTEMLDEVHVP
ncbi:MAG: amidohydrolase family protein [Phycisphaerae bacterium]|nr:amidohydrolase family protein [Phycisphaerae bacterium]